MQNTKFGITNCIFSKCSKNSKKTNCIFSKCSKKKSVAKIMSQKQKNGKKCSSHEPLRIVQIALGAGLLKYTNVAENHSFGY